MTDDLELAAGLVRDAGLLAARMLRSGVTQTRKTSVSNIVTDADHAAEELIVARLRSSRPADGIVGEEGTNVAGERTWYVDPVDGTYNFASLLPFWCSAVALVDADGPVLGAVYQPASDELWLGGRDHPTSCNGVPTPRLPDRRLAEISIGTYLHPATLSDPSASEPLLRAMAGAATVRMFGSGSVEMAAVAAGRIGAWIERDTADWDWYPGVALVSAAGGTTRVVHADGHHWHIAGPTSAVTELATLVLHGTS